MPESGIAGSRKHFQSAYLGYLVYATYCSSVGIKSVMYVKRYDDLPEDVKEYEKLPLSTTWRVAGPQRCPHGAHGQCWDFQRGQQSPSVSVIEKGFLEEL